MGRRGNARLVRAACRGERDCHDDRIDRIKRGVDGASVGTRRACRRSRPFRCRTSLPRRKSACWIFSPARSRRAITPGAGRRSASRARSQAAQPSSGPARLPHRAMPPSPTQPWATAWCAKTCTPPASRHHGVVIWPTLLALSERTSLSGATFLGAAIIGYEAGAQIGRALVTADLARLYRPTGLVGAARRSVSGKLRPRPQ